MTRLLGYFANQTDRIRCALALEAPALHFGEGRVDAWGIGSYQGSEVLLRRRPTESREPPRLDDVVRDLRTACTVAHARDASAGPRTVENMQPFRHRQWLFAHAGRLPRFADARRALLAGVPDHLARNARGDTDSEALFHVFLGVVQRAGRLDDPDFDRQGIAAALADTVAAVDAACGPGAELNLIVTHGHAMVALRRGRPLSWVRRRSLPDCAVCGRPHEVPGHPPRRVDHDTLRYLMIAGDAAIEGPGWSELPDGACLAVDRNLDAQVVAL